MPRGGKRKGAGRKSLKEIGGDDTIEITARLYMRQHAWVTEQSELRGISAAEYIRTLIDKDIAATPTPPQPAPDTDRE